MNKNKKISNECWKEGNFDKETIKKISINKSKLEKKLKVKLEIKANNIELEGKEFNCYIAEKVLEAIDRNFPVNIALLLTDEDYFLEDIQIRNIRDKNIKQTKARIIGTKGKTLKLLSELSSCYITLHNNTVSIIGKAEKIKEITTAIENLIRGSKQVNIYSYLERVRKKFVPEDLGLKQ